MSPRRLGWGLVGCGWIGRDHVLPAILASPSSRVAAVADPDPSARAEAASRAPGVEAVAGLEELLAVPGVDAVYVATPNHLHADAVVTAAAAGRHVLCEKPMAASAADATRMVAACEAAGVTYATAFDQRHHDAHRAIAAAVADGLIGRVTLARTHYACWLPPTWSPHPGEEHDNWRVDPARAGGGALIDLAPHGVDLLEVLVGSPLVALGALVSRAAFDYPVDDVAVLSGRFASGALASLAVAYCCPDAVPRRTLELWGTHGSLTATNTMGQVPGGRVVWHRDDGTSGPLPGDDGAGWPTDPFTAEVEAFARAVLDGAPVGRGGGDDLRLARLLEGAVQPC